MEEAMLVIDHILTRRAVPLNPVTSV